jgi:hypothetical protein
MTELTPMAQEKLEEQYLVLLRLGYKLPEIAIVLARFAEACALVKVVQMPHQETQLDRIEAKLDMIKPPPVDPAIFDAIAKLIGAWPGDMLPIMYEVNLIANWIGEQREAEREARP